MWTEEKKGFKYYLQFEKGLSENSVKAYLQSIEKLTEFLIDKNISIDVKYLQLNNFQDFLKWLNSFGISSGSQARIISGIKSFYKYLLIADKVNCNPVELLEFPRTIKRLPDTLNIEDINSLFNAIDLSKTVGKRNRAMLETLYSSGLRVSELINLKISNLFFLDGYIKVIGKGNKERIVPIGSVAINYINLYKDNVRCNINVQRGNEDILFLNNKGKKLTRIYIFHAIKQLSEKIGLEKNASPHTFRHSFATHLIEGGADLRSVQEMLGHLSITTTEIYTRLCTDHLRFALNYHPRASVKVKSKKDISAGRNAKMKNILKLVREKYSLLPHSSKVLLITKNQNQ
jgi:integrase/recombinase XerD